MKITNFVILSIWILLFQEQLQDMETENYKIRNFHYAFYKIMPRHILFSKYPLCMKHTWMYNQFYVIAYFFRGQRGLV